MPSFPREEQILVAEEDRRTRSKPADPEAQVGAMQSYQTALATTIADVADEEVDGIILSLDSEQKLAREARV